MNAAPQILADSVGPGGTAALVVLVLIVVCIGIFVALLGSLKRLRGNVSKGTFQGGSTSNASGVDPSGEPEEPAGPPPTATRGRKGRAGGGA